MAGQLLTRASQIQCVHGAPAVLLTTNAVTKAVRADVLLETDVHLVTGCPFVIGLKPSPCVRIEWTAGASAATVQGTKVLTRFSVGKCISPEGAVQGVAIIASTQTKVSAR
jgi:hypothetical protein